MTFWDGFNFSFGAAMAEATIFLTVAAVFVALWGALSLALRWADSRRARNARRQP